MAIAGVMDKRTRFERRATSPDGYGNERGAWQALTTVWAQLRSARPAEMRDGAERSAEELELRFRRSIATAAIAAGDRAVIDGRAYRLLGDPIEAISRSGVLMARVARDG